MDQTDHEQIWGDGIPTIIARDPFSPSRVTSRAPSIDLNGSRINLGSHTPSGYFPKKGPSELVAEIGDTEGLAKDVEQQKDARESLARPLILTSSIFVITNMGCYRSTPLKRISSRDS